MEGFGLLTKELREIVDLLENHLNKYFGDRVEGYMLGDFGTIPYNTIKIDFTLYHYFTARLLLEGDSVYFGITENGIALRIFEKPVHLNKINEVMGLFDEQIRLRIPDKFLEARAWVPLKIEI